MHVCVCTYVCVCIDMCAYVFVCACEYVCTLMGIVSDASEGVQCTVRECTCEGIMSKLTNLA